MMAMTPYFLAGIILQNPNATIVRVVSFIPFTSATTMLMRVGLGKVPVVDVIVSILILVISIPLLLWAGAKVFRMGLLVYGKRPSMAVIWKAIKSS